jgi:hypothetical protein
VALDIVRLSSPKFGAVVATLQQRWSQDMPDILFADNGVNDLLIMLENFILEDNDRLLTWQPPVLSWRSKEKNGIIPIPVIGLEHTLSLYGIDRSVRFSAITVLDLRNWSLPGIFYLVSDPHLAVVPRWITMMPNIRLLHLQNSPIQFLPSWMVSFKSLVHICASTMLCHHFGPSQTVVVEKKSPSRCNKLVDLVAATIRQHLDRGGDWTVVVEALPRHLLERISSCPPLMTAKQTLQLKDTNQVFVVEMGTENLTGTPWKQAPIEYIEGAGDPQVLPLYRPRKVPRVRLLVS